MGTRGNKAIGKKRYKLKKKLLISYIKKKGKTAVPKEIMKEKKKRDEEKLVLPK